MGKRFTLRNLWASAAFTRVLRFIRIRIVLVLLRVYYYFFFFDAFNIASLSRTMAFFGLMDLSAFDVVVVVKPVFFPPPPPNPPVCPPNSWYVSPCAPESLARLPPTVRVRRAAAKAESFAFFCFIKLPSKSSSPTPRTSSPASASPALSVFASKSNCVAFVEYMSCTLSFSPIKSGTILNA